MRNLYREWYLLMRANRDALAAELEEAQRERDGARNDLAGYRKTLDQADAKIYALRAELEEAQRQNERDSASLDWYASRLGERNRELEKARRQNEEWIETAVRVESELEEAKKGWLNQASRHGAEVHRLELELEEAQRQNVEPTKETK